MGRHSRRGRGDSADTSGISAGHGAVPRPYATEQPDFPEPRQYGGPQQHGLPRPAARPERGAPAGGHEASPDGGAPRIPETRGGHPEHREPGGSWGRGPGRAGPMRGPRGPRPEYVEAFDDGVFPAEPRAAGRYHRPGDGAAAPSTPAAPGAPASGDGGGSGQAPPDGEQGVPEGEQGQPDGGEEEFAPLGTTAATGVQRRGVSGAKRTAAGIGAAAVTTVLAVVVAGQAASGEHRDGDRAAGAGVVGRAGADADPASRSESGGRGAPAQPSAKPTKKPLSYDQKLAKPYPMDADLKGSGKFRTVGGSDKGPGEGQKLRYRVDVERKIGLDGDLFAKAVHKTLNDQRSWAHNGERSFERVSKGHADFVITLASPGTTDVWCMKSGLDTSEQKVSCDSAATERVMINGYRWAQGSKTFGDDRMRSYREMLINHEVGHRIGFGHVGCPKDGERAPVMMQQTKSLNIGGATCKPNAWPHPDA